MKPKIVFLADRREWAFSLVAQEITKRLKNKYHFTIIYSQEGLPNLNRLHFDLLYIFFWGDESWRKYNIPPEKVIREVASYRWRDHPKYGKLSHEGFCKRYLSDCNYVTTPCLQIAKELARYRNKVVHLPNGTDTKLFNLKRNRQGGLKIGWAGNPNDTIKGLKDILLPATTGKFDFKYTDGTLNRREMVNFYNEIDVIAIASLSESQPLPLIEAMACGCYPVATNVGIVPEIVEQKKRGIIVNRTIEDFITAFTWCQENLEHVRSAGISNAKFIQDHRDWRILIANFDSLFSSALKLDNQNTNSNRKSIALKKITHPKEPNDPLQSQKYSQHLSEIQGSHGENYNSIKKSLLRELHPILPLDKNQAILEIGSGFGYLINLLVDMGYKNIVAADLSEDLIDHVRKRFPNELKGAFWCDGGEILLQNPNSFDLIFLYDVLEHIHPSELDSFAENLRNALSDGGKAIIRTPNMALPLSSFSRYIDITHKIGFTEYSLRQLFSNAGFTFFSVIHQEIGENWKDRALFRIYRYILRKLYSLEKRTVPTCFHKNLLVEVRK